MAHWVIGYPSLNETFKVSELYIQNQIALLELQIPFSHPTADGSVITEANRIAIKNKITLSHCFQFLNKLRQKYPLQEIIVMTYLNKIFPFGIEKFCEKLKNLKIKHCIIPDLPFDSEFANIFHSNPFVKLIPVIAANISDDNLKRILSHQPQYIYLMADFKITGSKFSLHPRLVSIIRKIKIQSSAKIGIGFGISKKEQIQKILETADFAILGSAFIDAYRQNKLIQKLAEISKIKQ